LVVGGNLWKSNLRVKRVVVAGAVNVEANQIIQLAQVPAGISLYDVDLTRVQRNVQSHYFIRRATVERDLAGSIRITVEERTPLAVVTATPLSYLDERGVVLPSSISKAIYDLPVLSGIPADVKLTPGTTVIQEDVQEALALLSVLKIVNREMFHRISEVRVRGTGDMVLTSAESGVPIIFGRGSIADKVARLEAFWTSEVAERGAQNLEYVDLRFRDQVVVRWRQTEQKKRL
jgi:cell division protein FtsQ